MIPSAPGIAPSAVHRPGVRLVACTNPFTTERVDLALPEGLTLAEMIELAQPDPILRAHAHVFLGEEMVAREWWGRVRPKAGQVIAVRVVPEKSGGGGGGGKNPLRAVLTIAVMAASLAMGPALGAMILGPELATTTLFSMGALTVTAGGLIGGAIISAVGNLMINALIPPPKPGAIGDLSRGGASSDRASDTLSITGSSNQAGPFGPVPTVLGRHRVFPKKAAREYTEVQGNDQYLRCLFDFGYGPLEVAELRIGATPIEQFEGVEMELRPGWDDDSPITLYSNTIREDGYNLKVTQAGGRQIVETRDQADEILLDVGFAGLVYFDDSGNRKDNSVTLRVEWRAVGTETWTLHVEETITGATESAIRHGWRIVTGQPGRYQVGVTRLTADNTSTRYRNDSFITAARTVQYVYPVRKSGRCLLALRIKATNQLTGVIDQLNGVASRIYRVWDGSAFAWQTSRHPAWAYLYLITGAANPKRKADSQVNLGNLKAWADGDPGRTFDAVLDYDSTVFEILRDVAAAARVAYGKPSGKYGVVRDVPQTTPAQVFTPRNSWGFKGTRTFTPAIHGFRCKYIEPARDWSPQEVVAYADGYDESTATKLESLDMFGGTDRTQAWKDGRFHLAQLQLRPENYEFFADIEHIVCERGDLIRCAHDVPLWGGGSGRVKALIKDGEDRITGVRLDERMVMEAGKHYVLRVRGVDHAGGFAHSLATEPGESDILTFLAVPPLGAEPAQGDLAVFGEADRETVPLLVKSIHPGSNLTARLVCVDAAPAIHQADQGPIPAWDPMISVPALYRPKPAQPAVAEIITDERAIVRGAGGALICRIRIILAPRSGAVTVDRIESQVRPTGSGEAWTALPALSPFATEIVVAPVAMGEIYDLRLRAVSLGGIPSDWTLIGDCRVTGTETPPPGPTELLVEKLPSAALRYRVVGETAIDHQGFRFRWNLGVNARWETAAPAHPGTIAGSQFEAAAFADRTFTMLVKAIDSSGHESEGAAWAVVQLGDLVTERLVDSLDFQAEGWPGAIEGGAVADGSIAADASTLLFTDPAQPLFADPATALIDSYQALVYETTFTPARDGHFTLDWILVGDGAQVRYRRPGGAILFTDPNIPLFTDADDSLFAPPSWLSWVGPFAVVKGETIDVRVDLAGGSAGGRIDRLTALIDVPVATEHLEDISIPLEGMRLPLSRSYEEIVKVGITVQSGGGHSAVRLALFDKSIAGPLVRGYDTSNNPAAALADIDIQGVLAV